MLSDKYLRGYGELGRLGVCSIQSPLSRASTMHVAFALPFGPNGDDTDNALRDFSWRQIRKQLNCCLAGHMDGWRKELYVARTVQPSNNLSEEIIRLALGSPKYIILLRSIDGRIVAEFLCPLAMKVANADRFVPNIGSCGRCGA
jgi:hypothetical protein